MNDIEETLRRNVTQDKIKKFTKDRLMEAFFKGSEYEEDYKCLKIEFPNLINYLNIDDSWMDSKNIKRIAKNNYFLITKKLNEGELILGEIKFNEDGTPLFARYNNRGMFNRRDTFIIHNKKIFKGSIPDSEYIFKPQRSDQTRYDFYLEDNLDRFSIDYTDIFKQKKLILTKEIPDKKIEININYYNNPLTVPDIINIKVSSMINFEVKDFVSYDINRVEIKKYVPYIIKIEELHNYLRETNFSKNELETYLQIHDIFIKNLMTMR